MSAVEVEISRDQQEGGEGGSGEERTSRRARRSGAEDLGADVEREVTKRELIRSVSNILIVLLYMVFTLLRDRDSGVVVVDSEDDDWED